MNNSNCIHLMRNTKCMTHNLPERSKKRKSFFSRLSGKPRQQRTAIVIPQSYNYQDFDKTSATSL